MIPNCKQNNTDYQKLKDELNQYFKSFEDFPSGNFNEIFKNGIYWYNSGCENVPTEQYGVILVISSPKGDINNTSYWWTFQIAFSTNNNIFIRHTTDGESWSDWMQK